MRLLLSDVAAARHGAAIRATVSGVALVPVPAEAPPPSLTGCTAAFMTRDLFVGGTRHRLTPRFLHFVEVLKQAPDLHWVHTFSAGTDMQPYQEMMARGLTLTNSAGASASAVAATAVTGLMALARQFPRAAEAQRRHAWEPLYSGREPTDVEGQHALVIGTGPIGQRIGVLCRAFGLRTTGVRRNPGAGLLPGFDAVASYEALPDLLPTTQWLLLACPLVEATRNLVDAALLARLPAGAHMVNVSRGGIVVEADLLAALRSGHIAGAFLDVFTMEPLPADSPFWDLPNVIVSPHSAAASDGLPEKVAEIFCDNLRRFLAGEPLRNIARPV